MKKIILQIASFLFPTLVINKAYRTLTSPQVRKLRVHELEVLNTAEKSTVPFKGFDIQLYCWKQGAKRVLLVHGWEGQAGNFSDLVERLLKENYSVFAFDGPSHGFSSTGKTSLFEFTELVGLLIKKLKVENLVSHSFGGVATTYALYNNPDITIEKYALLTTPDRFLQRIDTVAAQVGIPKHIKLRLIERVEKEANINAAEMNVSDFVQTVKVVKAMILHDKNDTVIPIGQSKNVQKHWKNCTFHEIEGTGHFRILRTPAVLDRVIAFLNQESL